MPSLIVRRNPFDGLPHPDASGETSANEQNPMPPSAQAPGEAPGAATDLAGGFDFAGESPRVPDIGASDVATRDGDETTLALKATIAGRHAIAYVQTGTTLEIVRTGDRLGSRTIARIDFHGITFDDGSRLELSDTHPAPESVPAPPSPRTLTLDDLRRELAPLRRMAGSVLPAPPSASASASETTSPPAPSAGPLATVDSRGREPDDTPTPDTVAATPYPVPGIDR